MTIERTQEDVARFHADMARIASTPGPWRVGERSLPAAEVAGQLGALGLRPITRDGVSVIALVPDAAQDDPDAVLMAAAPEMADTIEEALGWLEAYHEKVDREPDDTYEFTEQILPKMIEEMRRAVGKARGVEPGEVDPGARRAVDAEAVAASLVEWAHTFHIGEDEGADSSGSVGALLTIIDSAVRVARRG